MHFLFTVWFNLFLLLLRYELRTKEINELTLFVVSALQLSLQKSSKLNQTVIRKRPIITKESKEVGIDPIGANNLMQHKHFLRELIRYSRSM